SLAICIYDDKYFASASQANGDKARLTHSANVLDRQCHWIGQNTLRVGERHMMLLEIGRSFDRVVLKRHTSSIYTLYAYRKAPALCVGLTTKLSGRPRSPLSIGEHAIHCEHDAPTMIHGPLQRVVRWRLVLLGELAGIAQL